MNMNNQRLREIQQLKAGYKQKMIDAPTMTEAFEYQDKYIELENEEKEILKMYDVIL